MKKLFKKEPSPIHPHMTDEEMRASPDFIQVHDASGEEIFIDKEAWRKEILPGVIEENSDNPDALVAVIADAMTEGLFADVEQAARNLHRNDSAPERSGRLLGAILMKIGKLDEAKNVFESHIDDFGDDLFVLANLASVHGQLGQDEIAKKTLWRALELDPNYEMAFEIWAAVSVRESGDEGLLSAMEQVSTIEGSWKAQLWFAQAALEKQDFEKAREYHDAVLSMQVVPPEALVNISGSLGNAGRLNELVERVGRRYEAEQHGLEVGLNLMKAYVQLEDRSSARQILTELSEMNRPDWKVGLDHIAGEIG